MRIITLFITFLLFATNVFANIDVEEVKEKLALIQNTGNSGRDFWFTIPPVYSAESTGNDNFIKILVVSAIETNVQVSVGSSSFQSEQIATPGKVISFDLTETEAQPILHTGSKDKQRPAKVYKDAAIHVESDFPIIVYVIVKFHYISDGFFAIPTNAMGTHYINSAYKEPGIPQNGWFSPFTGVVGVYDNTKVSVTMGGGDSGNDEIPYDDGSTIKTGEKKTSTISRGDVLLLSINGEGQDLSGSKFEGDKPFAIVSGVNCANIPVGVLTCDYIVNMEIPVNYWGKDYFVTPVLGKTFNGIVRIYASEDDTEVYKDGEYIGTISKGGGASIGQGFLEMRLWNLYDDQGKPFPPTLAHLSSDKPIAVVYYSTGSSEDEPQSGQDPFMMQIPPIINAVNHSIVSTPNSFNEKNPFTVNNINITFSLVNNEIPDDLLIAEITSSTIEPQFEKLKVKFDDTFNRFATTYNGKSFASKSLSVPANATYIIKSDSTSFLTESYGFKPYESYGLPTTLNLIDKSKGDSISPVVSYIQQCNGDILEGNASVSDMPEEEEARSNMSDLYPMALENYEFEWNIEEEVFISGLVRTINWSLTVKDRNLPAAALLYFVDRAGNDTTIFIEYEPNAAFEVTESFNLFTNPNYTSRLFQDTIRNISALKPLYITKVEFKDSESGYKIDSFEPQGWMPGQSILPNEEVYINITFNPAEFEDGVEYKDSLGIGTGKFVDDELEECSFGYVSEFVSEYHFPNYELNGDSDYGEFKGETQSVKRIKTIKNLSSEIDLFISRIELKDGNKGFTLGSFTPIGWSIGDPIMPNEEIKIDIIFDPTKTPQTDEDIILIDSLGVGISAINNNSELEELSFEYTTEEKAVVKAKDPDTSIEPQETLSEYILVTLQNIEILPNAIAVGFTELEIFDMNGSKVAKADITAERNISLNSLLSGSYVITLKSDERLLTRKLNVVR